MTPKDFRLNFTRALAEDDEPLWSCNSNDCQGETTDKIIDHIADIVDCEVKVLFKELESKEVNILQLNRMAEQRLDELNEATMTNIRLRDELESKDVKIHQLEQQIINLKAQLSDFNDEIVKLTIENKKENQMENWSSEWPTEEGRYWFFGTLSKYESMMRFYSVKIRLSGNNLPMYICEGNIMYKEWGAKGQWTKALVPSIPQPIEENK